MSLDLSFTLNVAQRQVSVRADASLLEVLRERCGITWVKDGCSPQGQCGCCLALIDGQPKVSCATPARAVQGRDVRTLEGLSQADRQLCARAFAQAAGVQCGFCIPGIALRAVWLLDRQPSPSRADIARAIDVGRNRVLLHTL